MRKIPIHERVQGHLFKKKKMKYFPFHRQRNRPSLQLMLFFIEMQSYLNLVRVALLSLFLSSLGLNKEVHFAKCISDMISCTGRLQRFPSFGGRF